MTFAVTHSNMVICKKNKKENITVFAAEWTHSTHLEKKKIGKQQSGWITNHYKSEIFGQKGVICVFSHNDDNF